MGISKTYKIEILRDEEWGYWIQEEYDDIQDFLSTIHDSYPNDSFRAREVFYGEPIEYERPLAVGDEVAWNRLAEPKFGKILEIKDGKAIVLKNEANDNYPFGDSYRWLYANGIQYFRRVEK